MLIPATVGIREDTAAQHGLYCWPYLRDLASIEGKDSKREALLRKVVNQFKNHPGFGFWKGALGTNASGAPVITFAIINGSARTSPPSAR